MESRCGCSLQWSLLRHDTTLDPMCDTRVMQTILTAAGAVAMEHFMNATAMMKADRTVVTEADLAVQALLVDALARHYPQDGVIAEEEGLRKPSHSGRFWTVDPIDGTLPFLAGLTTWGIAVGLLENDIPVAGFIYAPPSNDLYHAVPGGQPCRNGRPLRMKQAGPLKPDCILLTHTRPHQRYELAPSFPGRVFCLGSASMHLASVATGGADAVLIGHDKIWDLAPGLALLRAGGGELRYLDGAHVTMDGLMDGAPAHLPMLGGHAQTIEALESCLNYWDPEAVEYKGHE